MTNTAFLTVYALCTVALVFFEGLAIGRPSKGDTISENVWNARGTLLVFVLAPLWFWMTWHFWAPWEPDGRALNDAAAILCGGVVGYVNYRYVRRRR